MTRPEHLPEDLTLVALGQKADGMNAALADDLPVAFAPDDLDALLADVLSRTSVALPQDLRRSLVLRMATTADLESTVL
ncbi:hypothetical protein H696_05645 [Fonticula alba]|uniref:Uncharacterized protein n=1 Tax=Fonticula alba TaxID=691883 RepID=A0A058Z1W2_FONAL|nr:hypothetical protein H696_05645 [Fonticula alba]KCV67918.1 hypothetical protein H696_05645 [Fonticula alba]|eukprot:XP_009497738.1 hypothetical protein H696_05645 [Fonticula alba]